MNIDEIENNEGFKRPFPVPWKAFDLEEFPAQKWWIKNLVPYEGFVIIAAPSGEKKTWIAMEIAKCIARGENFLGSEYFPCENGNVLYIDQEMPRALSQDRGRLLGLNDTNMLVYYLNQDFLNFNTEDGKAIEWLYDFVEEKDISVVIIDTFRAVAGGLKEEKAEEIRSFMNQLKPFKNKGVTLIFLDHCRKPAQHENKTTPRKEQLFASQDKLASVEVLIMIRSDERSEEIRVHQLKNRGNTEFEPFKIIMKSILDEDAEDVRAKAIKFEFGEFIGDDREYQKDIAMKEILVSLEATGGSLRKDLIKAVCKETGIGKRNVEQAIRDLEAKKVIAHTMRGKEYFFFLPTIEDLREDKSKDEE